MSKRLSNQEYQRIKILKQHIKSVPERETKEPLLKSTVAMKVDPYGMGDMISIMFPLMMMAQRMGRNRRPWK